MIATVVSVGGLAAMVIFLAPLGRKKKTNLELINLHLKIIRRIEAAGWFCAAVLVGTGLLQMSANPNYSGFLEIGNRWTIAILIKHLFFLLVVILSAYISLVPLPGLRRSYLRASQRASNLNLVKTMEDLSTEVNRVTTYIVVDLILAVFILGLTAIARVS
jgi:hypothetical protein